MAEDRRWRPSLGAFVHITGFAPRDWEAQLHDISQLDDRGHVEIWFEWLPKGRHEFQAVVDLFAEETVLVHAPFIGLSLASPWQELRHISVDRIVETCAVADELGAQVLTVHPGVSSIFESREHTLDRVAESYEGILRHAPRVTITIENMPDRGGITAEGAASLDECFRLMERVPEVKLTLDIGHAIQNSEDYETFFIDHADLIYNIHLHDAQVRGPAHLTIGHGELSIDMFVRKCIESDYHQFVGIETIGIESTVASWRVVRDAISSFID